MTSKRIPPYKPGSDDELKFGPIDENDKLRCRYDIFPSDNELKAIYLKDAYVREASNHLESLHDCQLKRSFNDLLNRYLQLTTIVARTSSSLQRMEFSDDQIRELADKDFSLDG